MSIQTNDAKFANSLAFNFDFNIGTHNQPRKLTKGSEKGWFGTTNVTGKLRFQAITSKHGGLGIDVGVWVRMSDFEEQFKKTVMRPFLGLLASISLFNNEDHSLTFVESPNLFYGTDLNRQVRKDWESWEFGNFASLIYKYKPNGLSFDVHNWFVRGLNVTITGDRPADETGIIVGSTFGWNPFGKLDNEALKPMSFYARYRWWHWKVEPKGTRVSPQNWHEVTFGITGQWPIWQAK